MSEHLRCQTCGGSVVYDIAVTGAACMFCGDVALTAVPAEETVPTPHAVLPFEVDRQYSDEKYRAWAQGSWFYPKALRTLDIRLQPMFIPAWRFDSLIETHWAGLTRASTRSGKAPTSGRSEITMRHMVPASTGLNQRELTELLPFREDGAAPWDPDQQHHPWEPPAITEQGARKQAHELMAESHGRTIASSKGLLRYKISPVVHDRDVKLMMIPIYIGAFRFRERPWRFVVNAQSGEVVGKAPIDRVKVLLLTLGGLAVIGLIAALVMVLSG